MAKILYIEVSPRQATSYSATLARQFLDAYQKQNPTDTIETINLWEEKLPSAGGIAAVAKYAIINQHPMAEAAQPAWNEILGVIARFKSADKYVFSIPMWNFGIPYVLKHYIDLIVQPGQTFGKTPEGKVAGLIPDRPVLCFTASGSSYGPQSPLRDFMTPYLEWIFGFMGLTNLRFVTVAPTTLGADAAQAAKVKAEREAMALVGSF